MFKHPKINNVTQTLLKKHAYHMRFIFQNHSFQCLNTENCCLESHTKHALSFQVTLLSDLFANKLKIMGPMDKTKLFFSPTGPPLYPFFFSFSFNKITFFSLLKKKAHTHTKHSFFFFILNMLFKIWYKAYFCIINTLNTCFHNTFKTTIFTSF